jgi:hypothetical protein
MYSISKNKENKTVKAVVILKEAEPECQWLPAELLEKLNYTGSTLFFTR